MYWGGFVLTDQKRELLKAVILFVITFFSVFLVYGYQRLGGDPLRDFQVAQQSFAFAGSLLLILLCHEMGHFLVGRSHGFHTSLPIFIPFPLALGTLGAIIKLKSLPKSRTALLEMGAAGPICGFFVALIFIFIGLLLSTNDELILLPKEQYQQLTEMDGVDEIPLLIMGDPLILKGLGFFVFGEPLSPYAHLHPIAFAGWVGCLLTAMNMLPIGQLDGGHVMNALFPKYAAKVSKYIVVVLIISGWFWPGWTFWGIIALITRAYKPIPIYEYLPSREQLTRRGYMCAIIAIICALLSFVPIPIDIQYVSMEEIGFK